jgi:hypothetical protein
VYETIRLRFCVLALADALEGLVDVAGGAGCAAAVAEFDPEPERAAEAAGMLNTVPRLRWSASSRWFSWTIASEVVPKRWAMSHSVSPLAIV